MDINPSSKTVKKADSTPSVSKSKNKESQRSVTTSNPAFIKEGYRVVPSDFDEVPLHIVQALIAEEWVRFNRLTKKSKKHNGVAKQVLPLGVTSSFQHWDPYPITMAKARGAYLYDVDGRKLLDLSMGFGAMLVGHLNKHVVAAVKNALDRIGTLFVTPATISTFAAEKFKARFDLDMLRFVNSGTEATMYAIRVARAATGKSGVVKIEGGYHGGYDPLQVSVKPDLSVIGEPDNLIPFVPSDGVTGEVFVVPYNTLPALEKVLKAHSKTIACFILEPVVENLSIILPDEGYLEGVRSLCDKYKVALIFDEVKTGLTAGYAGAGNRIGVKPDLITLAKSVGGGMPIAMFGGKKEYMNALVDGRTSHYGTYNGNPVSVAAMIAVDKIVTKKAIAKAEAINDYTLDGINKVINKYKLPAHTVGFGVKGAIIWSPTANRNYRDFKNTDFALAELAWLWFLNRGIVTPPGLDEQWLVSLATTKKDMDRVVVAFEELAKKLRSYE
jgi:glutamate-1-semialdehyde 2,1-aminomutase